MLRPRANFTAGQTQSEIVERKCIWQIADRAPPRLVLAVGWLTGGVCWCQFDLASPERRDLSTLDGWEDTARRLCCRGWIVAVDQRVQKSGGRSLEHATFTAMEPSVCAPFAPVIAPERCSLAKRRIPARVMSSGARGARQPPPTRANRPPVLARKTGEDPSFVLGLWPERRSSRHCARWRPGGNPIDRIGSVAAWIR